MKTWICFGITLCLALSATAQERPDPLKNPASPLMLAGDWLPDDPHQIDFANLPRVSSRQVIVSDVRAASGIKGQGQAGQVQAGQVDKQKGGVNQHNYLVRYQNQFFLMWSDGPGVEDRVGQRVKFATSSDGLDWQVIGFITPEPPGSGPGSKHYGTRSAEGLRYIARGFWIREGQLLALASLDEAAGFFGPSLALHAFRWEAAEQRWAQAGVVAQDAINNFPPRQLRDGQWLMSRRRHNYKQAGVEFLLGGTRAIDDWESFPVLGSSSELKAEEPEWWELPDGNLAALFRDNARSGYLYRSFSTDSGRSWTRPAKTNFPDATSKLCGLRLSDGRYILVSNSNPKRRDPLTIAISDDGLVFDRLLYVVGGRHVDYPHVIEHAGQLFIAYSGGKQTVEVAQIDVKTLHVK